MPHNRRRPGIAPDKPNVTDFLPAASGGLERHLFVIAGDLARRDHDYPTPTPIRRPPCTAKLSSPCAQSSSQSEFQQYRRGHLGCTSRRLKTTSETSSRAAIGNKHKGFAREDPIPVSPQDPRRRQRGLRVTLPPRPTARQKRVPMLRQIQVTTNLTFRHQVSA